MGRPLALVSVALPLALLLAACSPASPKPTHTDKTDAQICADLGVAVKAFYKVANPGSTVKVADLDNLPMPNGVIIPKPSCSFEMRPDPDLVPGDVWTLENFYLHPKKGLDTGINDRLLKAGYLPDAGSTNYSAFKHNVAFSASILTFTGKDDQPYSKAAGSAVLDFTLGQG